MADQHIGYPGTVNASQLATWMPNVAAAQYSVEGLFDGRVVTNNIGDRGVTVTAGTIIGDGIMDVFTGPTNLNFSSVASGSPDRWDMVVLRRTWSATVGASTSIYTIIPGGPNPTLPARNNNKGTLSDQPMALCRIKAGSTAVQEILDLRCWASNGGVQAIHDLVMSYLDQVGTHLFINGSLWIRQVASDGSAVAWNKVSQENTIDLFGVGGMPAGNSTPPAGTQFLVQTGSTVLTTDSNGFGKLIYPKPFPKGLVSITLTNGDDYAFNDMGIGVAGGSWGTSPANKTYTAFQIWGAVAGVRKKQWPNRTIRINWTAIGW